MGRTPCCEKNGLKKGPWTPEEDQKLVDYIQKNGYGNWRTLPKNAGLQRCGKSCRLRWTNYLRPDIKRGRFAFEEEESIIQLHSILGNKWSAIAARLPGRTDNEVKNYWNTHIRKRLLRMGIDPVTHSPRLDLLDLSSLILTPSSLYNNSSSQNQMNLSRLLGHVQLPLVNPELLRLATSLLSSHRENPNFISHSQNNVHDQNHLCNIPQQEVLQNQLPPPLVGVLQQNQIQALNQEIPILNSTSCVPLASETQLKEPNVDLFSSDFPIFSSQSCQLNEWQSNDHDCVTQPNYGFYGSDSSNFQSNCGNKYFSSSYPSVLSTPESSSTQLNSNSNSTHVNGSCSTGTTTEDERDSYCSDLLKFEIPEMFDVISEFM